MQGILVIAHGSRSNETEKNIETITDILKNKFSGMPVVAAYAEFGEATIEKGIERLIECEVDEILAVPYFLFDGYHVKKGIPEEISRVLEKYPSVKLKFGRVLGSDKRIADILADRIEELI